MGSITQKIEILGDASKYDICASMASPRIADDTSERIGSPTAAGICHAFTPDGRCISLFKVLLTNNCQYDCSYCTNRCNTSKRRVMFQPKELAKAFMGLYIRNYVEGLFLSSGVWKDATTTSERMLEAIDLIRNKYLFRGYIHIKILPGTDKSLIQQIMEIADRVSLNIEVPTASRLTEVSSMKSFYCDILRNQRFIHEFINKGLTPAGQTTQFIIGVAGETDQEILERLFWEYDRYSLKRGYFSAFTPIKGTPLEKRKAPRLEEKKRENFLYRTDWLYRRYNYNHKEIVSIMNDDGMIPLNVDPKISLALQDEIFPIDVNEASREELLRIPGIGETSARRITNLRKENQKITSIKDLRRVGAAVKRVKPFIILQGRRYSQLPEYFSQT